MHLNQFQKLPYLLPTNLIQHRLIALWVLCEAGLGGVLHSLKIPFSGIFLAGGSVLCLTLLRIFTNSNFALLRALLLVAILKAILSPQAPFTAYIALAFQGSTAYLLAHIPFLVNYPTYYILILCLICFIQSALQKIIILAIFYGKPLQVVLDTFGNYVFSQFAQQFSLTYTLVGLYLSIYLLASLLIALWIIALLRYTQQIDLAQYTINFAQDLPIKTTLIPKKTGKIKNKKLKITLLLGLFIGLSLGLFRLATWVEIIVYLMRLGLLLYLWYGFALPYLNEQLQRFLQKKKPLYAEDLEQITAFMPYIHTLAYQSWQQTSGSILKRALAWSKIILIQILFFKTEIQNT